MYEVSSYVDRRKSLQNVDWDGLNNLTHTDKVKLLTASTDELYITKLYLNVDIQQYITLSTI